MNKIVKAIVEPSIPQGQIMYGVVNPMKPVNIIYNIVFVFGPVIVFVVGIIASICKAKKSGNKKVAFIGTAITLGIVAVMYVIKFIIDIVINASSPVV